MPKDAQVLFTCTKEFKEALAEYAQRNRVSVAIVIREAVARQVGYDLANEDNADGRKRYASAEERKKAQAQRQRDERKEVRKLLEVLAREQRLQDALVIENSLRAKGVDPYE